MDTRAGAGELAPEGRFGKQECACEAMGVAFGDGIPSHHTPMKNEVTELVGETEAVSRGAARGVLAEHEGRVAAHHEECVNGLVLEREEADERPGRVPASE
jgi:hypothetical protein